MTAADRAPRLFSYVIARDYGFAPNPFFGFCTLATCKPRIRASAVVGDWVVGTSGRAMGPQRRLVYLMRVTAAVTFDDYWRQPEYGRKKPNLRNSRKWRFGDNIYHRDPNGSWTQLDSHHSYADGTPNYNNIRRDTQANRVLVSTQYRYWGGSGPQIPRRFRDFDGFDILAQRNHKNHFPRSMIDACIDWVQTDFPATGYFSDPEHW